MNNDDDFLPPNLDRRDNGRCRAFYLAMDNCPGNRNPFDYALQNYEKLLDKALILDQKHGILPCCKRPILKKLKPIRSRRRYAKKT